MDLRFCQNNTIAIISMNRGENKLNVEFLNQLNNALDQIERNPSIQVVITTGKGRFYSNGIDLSFYGTNPDKYPEFGKILVATLKRLLVFPILTIAAINGHAFAGGMLLALAHDLRVMRTGHGWMSFNEIYLKIRFPPAMLDLIKCKIPPGPTRLSAIMFGKRFTAEEALISKLVDRSASAENLLAESIRLGQEVCGTEVFDRAMFQHMKSDLYKNTVDALDLMLKQQTSGTSLKSQL
ncbi:uncharacterized protein LOC135475325 [Liolophura sinensis]|uniref:uncharacterized protein LOC135475325 n=1 Tax=Liolophura sinensis TaxID=3198878 RepID=UPI0031596776